MTAFAFIISTYTMNMQELFGPANAQGNVSNPTVLQGRTMDLYTGDNLFIRTPERAYQLATVTPPNWNTGCGDIDPFAGGFSFTDKKQFVAMLYNIDSNTLGYGFKLAIQNLCPACDNVMQVLQTTTQIVNRLNMNSCEAAKGIVNAAVPNTWACGKQNAAKNFGVDTNIFENIANAWTNMMNSKNWTNQTVNSTAGARLEAEDQFPTGNVVWKTLRKLDGVTGEQCIVLISMIGSMIFPTGNTPQLSIPLLRKEIAVEALVGMRTTSDTIVVPIWHCDTANADDCLSPAEDEVAAKSFKTMVREKMERIPDKIASRSAYDGMTAIIGFLNAIGLPIYKMLAVTTILNDASMANVLIDRHQELIAAKYVEVYIRRAVTDLYGAMARFSAAADVIQAAELGKMKLELEGIPRAAKWVLITACSQTISTCNIAQEVQYVERTPSANLSQTLRNSLTFGKNLR